MRVAIVYDRVNKWGGAERVLLELHKMFPDAPLYTSLYSADKAKWASVFNIKTSFLQRISFLRDKHELLGIFMPMAFESFNFSSYDLVISVTSESAKGIITPQNVKHICICLTPTRYLWSDYDNYFKGKIFKLISYPAVFYLKKWEQVAIRRPDRIIAISESIRRKVKKYYGLKSDVIYPPASSILETKKIILPKKRNYFLVVSRLVPYKNIEIAVRAAAKINAKLIVIGRGVEESHLKEIAGESIEFIDYVSDAELRGYLINAKALIYPSIEDFGIGMVEAQIHGTPVIAPAEGAAKEIIIDGKTGVLVKKQNVKSFTDILKKFKKQKYNVEDCKRNGMRFSNSIFRKKLRDYINDVIINN